MTRFEPTIGIAEFAQMIRESGLPISTGKLLAMSQAGVFDGYGIFVFRMEHIEGFIPESAARKWVADHSVEAVPTADMLAFAKMLEEQSA